MTGSESGSQTNMLLVLVFSLLTIKRTGIAVFCVFIFKKKDS